MTKRTIPLTAAFGAATLFILNAGAPAVHASTFTETTDAGQTLATAITATGNPPITAIFGTISSSTDVDLYTFNVIAPGNFAASTAFNSTGFDTQLFLFDLNGRAIASNNDVDPDPTDPGFNASSISMTLTPGKYYLGISAGGVTARDINGVSLFATGADMTAQYGANPATSLTLANFNSATGTGAAGAYQIDLVSVPEPSTWALLATGAGVLGTVLVRRRGQASLA